ncbi:MAG: hypothetical protein ACYTEK_22055 [Planctomycetota bacterium]
MKMYAQSRNLSHNAACLLPVVFSLLVMGGCLWPCTLNYQGWISRPVSVTVTDADTGRAVSDAVVKLAPDADMQRFLDNTANDKKKYEGVTGPDGGADLLIWFPSGGEQTRWLIFSSDRGKFGIKGAGTLQVNAGEYEPFQRELGLLVGEHRRSVNNKCAVEVSVKLVPSN